MCSLSAARIPLRSGGGEQHPMQYNSGQSFTNPYRETEGIKGGAPDFSLAGAWLFNEWILKRN
jgi:hypothetical protein